MAPDQTTTIRVPLAVLPSRFDLTSLPAAMQAIAAAVTSAGAPASCRTVGTILEIDVPTPRLTFATTALRRLQIV